MLGTVPRVSVDVRIPRVSPEQLWEFLWSARDSEWLEVVGHGPRDGQAVTVRSPVALPREGILTAVGDAQLEILLDDVPAARVTVTVAPVADGTRLVVHERAVAPESVGRVREQWRSVLQEVRVQVQRALEQGERPRQAVVIFHGIGHQRPGQTLGSFVESGVIPEAASTDNTATSWVKPDLFSQSYELRSYTFAADSATGRPTTDVFEVYWAHLIRDTSVPAVLAWALRLVLRRPTPAPLRPLVSALRAVLGVGVLVAVVMVLRRVGWIGADPGGELVAVASLLTTGALLLWRLLGRSVVGEVLGDAERYFQPSPGNIAGREAVRAQGTRLLGALHDAGRYDRVIVVGHSLGSVIAYDVLTHLWIQRRGHGVARDSVGFEALRAMERAAGQDQAPVTPPGSPSSAQIADVRELQWAAWEERTINGGGWLVTDFVTCGSPLTYAHLLLGASAAEVGRAQRDRVLPTCPPMAEDTGGQRRVSYERPYRTPRGDSATVTVLHHAALFGVTRWTNVYFPVSRAGLRGDLVGGPVAPVFGTWVHDVAAPVPPGFAHTRYWTPTGSGDPHISVLREALDLQRSASLRGLDAGARLGRRSQAGHDRAPTRDGVQGRSPSL